MLITLFENNRKDRDLTIQKNVKTVAHSLVSELDSDYEYKKARNGKENMKLRNITIDYKLRIKIYK